MYNAKQERFEFVKGLSQTRMMKTQNIMYLTLQALRLHNIEMLSGEFIKICVDLISNSMCGFIK